MKSEISSHESFIATVCTDGDKMISQGHFGAVDIRKKTSMLGNKWDQLKVCVHVEVCICVHVCVGGVHMCVVSMILKVRKLVFISGNCSGEEEGSGQCPPGAPVLR